ncbi:ribosome hibernation-promoting factor, HPF/YfiA family [Lacrimispora amygdalina]|uniref:ribosome hibernation-promoting factor, HPF/YfiA family n=1 Tax=Lacrimispora amygdalina TaxID=253257 RepID=UPI000BE2BCD8|nr:ribosome-associated translation inhibitor RaiA [Lacrimispora amygdalina]
MKISIIGKTVTITEGMREAITEKLSKCEKYLKESTPVKVLIRTVKDDQIIEVSIPIEKNKVIRAERRSKDLYEAIDMVEEVLARQLRKQKEKMLEKKRIPINSVLETEKELEEHYLVGKEKQFDLEMMKPEEAIEEMECLDHDFHIFMNILDGRIGVVYKRKEYGYGLLSANM